MESRGSLLTWSIENWITVVIMAALGYMLFAVVTQFFKQGGIGGKIGSYLPGSLSMTRPGG
jgi:hypothetical protein